MKSPINDTQLRLLTIRVWPVLALAVFAQPVGAQINVRDYGAKGDNVTDDTAAIRAAVAAAQRAYTLTKSSVPGGHGGIPSRPEIVFPSGRYLITEAIYIAGGVVRGKGEALLIQKHPDKDLITSQNAWRMTISGLTFVGGRNQLQLSNANDDGGFIQISECRFYGAAAVAVVMGKGSNSTQLKIRDCVFVEPEQALVSYTDETNVTDCWITSSRKMKNKAVIENRGGRMVLEKILGVPRVNGTDQRWIDVYFGNLTCRNFRFGGEGGGFTPVVNFVKYIPEPASFGLGPSIVLEGCQIYAGGNSKRRCAVSCEEIPNGITMRECALSVPAVHLSDRIDLQTYFLGARSSMLHFQLRQNRSDQQYDLPRRLQQPIVGKPTK